MRTVPHKQKCRRKRAWIDVDDALPESSRWDFAFCIFFTNQAGTVIMSFIGATLMAVTILFNWYAPNSASIVTRIVQFFILHIYLTIMMFGFILAFIAAYQEMADMAKAAAIIVLVGTIIYVILFLCSCVTGTMLMLYVCPQMRCSDHHWLQDARWRGSIVSSKDKKKLQQIEEEIRLMEKRRNSPHSKLQTESLEDKYNQNKHKYVILKDVFPWERSFRDRWEWNITVEPDNNQINESKYIEEERVEMKSGDKPLNTKLDNYIQVLEPNEEGNVLRVLISLIFTGLTLVFFIYACVTFFAYGRLLEHNRPR